MKEIKDKDVEIKLKLKTHYKVFDKKSDEYMTRMCKIMDDNITKGLFDTSQDIVDHLEILNMELYMGVTVEEIMKKVVGTDSASRDSFKYYLYILMVICYIYKMEDLDDDKRYILMCKTVEILNSMDTKKIKDEKELDEHLEDIIDDDLKNVLKRVYDDRKSVDESIMKLDISDMDTGLEFLNNTKIGELAKEISSSIDMSKLTGDNAEEMLDINALMTGSNNMLGDIIQTVGSKITEKIQTGELNQDILMNEALSMMGNLNNNGHGDMMTQMMGMMGSMMGNMDNGGNKTKERLQKKLANKKDTNK